MKKLSIILIYFFFCSPSIILAQGISEWAEKTAVSLKSEQIKRKDELARSTLIQLSTSIETYVTANNGNYPSSINDLIQPPDGEIAYLIENYCDPAITKYDGYMYDCNFEPDGYKIKATPVKMGETGSMILTIDTGSVISPPEKMGFIGAKSYISKLAINAESYATGHSGQYPKTISDLVSNPSSTIKIDLCGKETNEYRIICEFEENGYIFTAVNLTPKSYEPNQRVIKTGFVRE